MSRISRGDFPVATTWKPPDRDNSSCSPLSMRGWSSTRATVIVGIPARAILPAVRQKLHLSHRSDWRGRLCHGKNRSSSEGTTTISPLKRLANSVAFLRSRKQKRMQSRWSISRKHPMRNSSPCSRKNWTIASSSQPKPRSGTLSWTNSGSTMNAEGVSPFKLGKTSPSRCCWSCSQRSRKARFI